MAKPLQMLCNYFRDLELESKYSVSISKYDLTEIANNYMQALENAGYKPALYASISWYYDKMTVGSIKYPLWVAYYHDAGLTSTTFPDKEDAFVAVTDDADNNTGSNTDNTASPDSAKPSAASGNVGSSVTKYTVKKNDTINLIAKKYKVTLKQLTATNPQVKNINLIYVGQVLNIPKKSTSAVSKSGKFKVGDKVKVKKGSKTYTGGKIASFVFNNIYTIEELKNDRAVLDKKGICTPVNVKNLTKVK